MGIEESFNSNPEPEDERDFSFDPSPDPSIELQKLLLFYIREDSPHGELIDYGDKPEFLWPEDLLDQLEAARRYIGVCNELFAAVSGAFELRVQAALQVADRCYLAVTFQTKHLNLVEHGRDKFAVPALPTLEQVRFIGSSADLYVEQFDRPVLMVSSSAKEWRRGALPVVITLEQEFYEILRNAAASHEKAGLKEEDSRGPIEVDAAHARLLDSMIRNSINCGVLINQGDLHLGRYAPQAPETRCLIQRVTLEDIGDWGFFDAAVEAKHTIPGKSDDYGNVTYSVGLAYNRQTGKMFIYPTASSIERMREVLDMTG